MVKKITNWFGNNISFRTAGVQHAPSGRPGSWTFRSVVGQYYKKKVLKVIEQLKERDAKKRAKEAKNGKQKSKPKPKSINTKGESGKSIPFYQSALSLVESWVKQNEEREDEIHQLVDSWNTGPPAHIQQK